MAAAGYGASLLGSAGYDDNDDDDDLIDPQASSSPDDGDRLSTDHEINSSFKSITDDDLKSDGIPLDTPWTFWLDKSVPGASVAEYERCLKKIYTVTTVQSFWRVFNNIPDVSLLSNRYSYHLMRNQRRPVWEDEMNCQGGNWNFKCKKSDTMCPSCSIQNSHQPCKRISKLLLCGKKLLLALIGEQLVECMAQGDEIGGLSCSIRNKADVFQIWNVRSDLEEKSTVVEKVKSLLPEVNFWSVHYKTFQTHEAFEGHKVAG